jgi:hypothetical protein
MSRTFEDEKGTVEFAVDVPGSTEQAVDVAGRSVVFLEDFGLKGGVDEQELHHHALNSSRVVHPEECLAKLHVLPLTTSPTSTGTPTQDLRFLIVIAHQISDGLSAYNWFSHFLRILNTPSSVIESSITHSIPAETLRHKLPHPQEALYPKVAGNAAKQRWFWAIMRVLRHVQRPMPPTFTNPLRRETRVVGALPLKAKYAGVLDYSVETRPAMSCGQVVAVLSKAASARMMALCRAANVSIGAGCFALAGLSMMAIHEARYKDVPAAERPAFAASFPLNPRAFFGVNTEADSCMLAFSEGIVMPFLSSDLPIEGRFKLVAKQANRQLRVYQKRLKDKSQSLGSFDKHSSARLLATGYLAQIERVHTKSPDDQKTYADPQGALKPRIGKYGATCGVSSVGSTAVIFKPAEYDLENTQGKEFVANFKSLRMGVRARENEFLVGSSTNAESIVAFGVSYDLSAISKESAEKWAEIVSGLLEKGDGSRL